MENAPRRNRCSIFLHPGVACQKTFEDMVTSRQCTGHRKSPHTRQFRREVQSPFRLLHLSCPGSPSISLMVTKGQHQAASPRWLCDGSDVRKASPRCSDPRCTVRLARINLQTRGSFLHDGRKETDPIQIIDVNRQVQSSQPTPHLTVARLVNTAK